MTSSASLAGWQAPWRVLIALLAVSALTVASGCTQVTLADDVDLTLDFRPLDGPSSSLSSPYVEGSAMRIYVNSSNDHEQFSGWRVTSSAPDVFSVDTLNVDNTTKPITAFVHGRALRPGSAELKVFDGGGQQLGGDIVEVARPDEIRLLAHGKLLVGYTEADARVAELRVLAGGTATYLARYYQNGRELHGNGALSVPLTTPPIGQPVGGAAGVATSFLFEDRDWLQLTPQNPGTATVELLINGTPFGSFPVVAVATSDITSVHILAADESGAKSGDWLVTFAQALDASRREVYGVQYAWQIDSAMQDSLGDLFRYQYDPRQPKMLTASFGSMAAQTFIHAEKGYVDSTNHIGCSYAPLGRAAGWPALGTLALLGALLGLPITRRRRPGCIRA